MLKKFKHLKHFEKYLPKKNSGITKKIAFWVTFTAITLGLISIVLLGALFIFLSFGLPTVDELINPDTALSTQIFDREGNLLYTIHGEENREVVSLKNISQHLIDATIALEDDQFYEHPGFDVLAIGRAGLYEVFGIGSPRGGSTLTQQYVKNAYLSSERTYTRKLKELILAIRIEKALTKDEILEQYLNRIPYGNSAYGVQKAAQIYFGKDAADLTVAESSILASVLQAPTRYNPYGNNRYSQLTVELSLEQLENRDIEDLTDLKDGEFSRGLIGSHVALADGTILYIPGRTDHTLYRMEQTGKIDQEERQAALNELSTLEFNQYGQSLDHAHFILDVKEELEQKYGKEVVEQGGLKVYTTLDSELQRFAEKTAEEVGETNLTRFDADNNAILTINAKTGEILAMVGSRDYFNEEIDGNVNVVNRPRPVGSSFKPIVYAQAFYNGYAPSSVVYDVPTQFGDWRPKNYDGTFSGRLTLRTALGMSKNIPAAKAYFLAGEQDPIITLAEKMGITTLDRTHQYGGSLSLGAADISLKEMVTAYATFANNGKKPELVSILKVENSNGDILEEWKPHELPEVIDPQVSYLINNVLSDQSSSVGPRLFVSGQQNAAKTGTSTKESTQGGITQVRPSDAWTIGYTPSVVTGVWSGNTDGRGMGFNANGYDTSGPIYNAVMTKALEGKAAEPFPEPKGIQKVKISKASGKLPNAKTPASEITTGIFASFSVPTKKERNYQEVEIDKTSGLLATEYTPDDARITVTFESMEAIADKFNWQQEIYAFFRNNQQTSEYTDGQVVMGIAPTEYSTTHNALTESRKPTITIISPTTQSEVAAGRLSIEVDAYVPHGLDKIEYFVDGDRSFFVDSKPYTGHVNISRFLEDGSKHLIRAKIIDKLGYSDESVIEIKINNDLKEDTSEEDSSDE